MKGLNMEGEYMRYEGWLLPANAPASRTRRGYVLALAFCPRHHP